MYVFVSLVGWFVWFSGVFCLKVVSCFGFYLVVGMRGV